VNKAIPGLIEAGLDVINLQQPRGLGIEDIGRRFAGKICFETLCDIQKTLPRGNRREIRQEAELLLRCWGTPKGGFILGDYGDEKAIGAKPGTREFMMQTFRRIDPYRTQPTQTASRES
jgi:uroporphyrinogen decarboxylase